MKKSLVTILAISTLSYASNAELNEKVLKLEKELKKVKKELKRVKKTANRAKTLANGNHLKFDVDFKNSIDSIKYKMADGSTKKNSSLMSNRLLVNMKYDAGDKVFFYGTLGYYKTFGQNLNSEPNNTNNQFDWVSNEAANDNNIRLKEAYWLYKNNRFLSYNIPWTASIGRRPSTNGLGINFREGDKRKSAIASTVNVEFDGASFRWDIGEVANMEGAWIKLCAGRGLTSATPRFSNSGADYKKDENYINSNMIGVIFVPYDNGQYSLHTNYAKASGMIGYDTNISEGFKDFGDLELATVMFKTEGIGDEINDFLDDTILFASYSMSKTHPKNNKQMLGENDSKTGYSFWIGAQMPCLITDDGRFGIEYNKGSKYWRSMTYAEDTAIGSKIATRGDAFEVYWLKPLTKKSLSMAIRYTVIDYDYTGSNGFFGVQGKPVDIDSSPDKSKTVDKASDLRISIRYKF